MERPGRLGMVLAMAALVVLVAFIYFYRHETVAEPTPNQTATSTPVKPSGTTTSTEPVTDETCHACLGIDDGGKTIALAAGSRLTLLLPVDSYDKDTLSISPKGTLKEIFGASAPTGTWIRTFEATSAGTASIVVAAINRNNPPYALKVITLDKAHAWEDGFVVVTKTDANQTISLAKNERFVIQLGSDLGWTLKFEPKGSITRVAGSASTGGIQGVYEATTAGTATLTAIGAPICKAGEACPQFLLTVSVNFVIR